MNKVIRIKIDGFPPKSKKNWHSIISFATGSMLAISEALPFIDTKANGILHLLSNIQHEYKNDFK
jgi:hypothetical protein